MQFEKRHETTSGLSHWVAVAGHAEPFARFCLNDPGKRTSNPELVAARDLMMAAPALLEALRECQFRLSEALHVHVYDLSNGDVIPADCPYTAAIAQAGKAIRAADAAARHA